MTSSMPAVSPRGRKRTVPFKVMALGMSRSGTESLCKALTILGIPCYHGWRTMENHLQAQLWTEAVEAKYENKGAQWQREDFDQILGDYSATTDFPSALFPVEMIESYPEAKVILNQRPVDIWYQSTVNTATMLLESWWYWIMMNADGEARAIYRCWCKTNNHYFRHNVRRNAKAVYKEHEAIVKGAADSDRLLVYDVSQGWEPLCKFLGLPVPKEEFPSGNVAEEFHHKITDCLKPRFQRSTRNIILLAAATLGIGGYAAWNGRSILQGMV